MGVKQCIIFYQGGKNMLSKSIKRRIAILLTGIMVLGSTVTAFADEPAADPVTSISSEGEGKFEGHVNKKVVDVTLPTVSANTTPFSFIMDNEGLIPATTHAAYGDDFTFAGNKNVYFKTADKTYGNESTEFTVSNNSSVSVNMTIKVEVTPGAKDPKMVAAESELTDLEEAGLYLGLIVDGDAANKGTFAISENVVEKTFEVAGMPDNYSVSTNQVSENAAYPHTYTFKKDENATDWKKIQFKLTGAANTVDDAEGITAPALKVTWSYEAVDGDTSAPDITGATKVTGESYNYTADYTKGSSKVFTVEGVTAASKADTIDGTYEESGKLIVDSDAGTVTINKMWASDTGTYKYIKITVSGKNYIIRVTLK
jgi:hypothetical protein